MKKVISFLAVLVLLVSCLSFSVAEEKVTLRYAMPLGPGAGLEEGVKAVNEKMAADGLNIELEVIVIPFSSYSEKVTAMFAAGQPLDIIYIMQDQRNIGSFVGDDMIMPIDDLLKNYPALEGLYTEQQWGASTYNGSRYAVPAVWKDFSKIYGDLTTRSDIIEKHFDGKYPTDTEELYEYLKAMQAIMEKETGTKAYMWLQSLNESADFLSRTYDSWPFYVDKNNSLLLFRQDGTIESYFESEEFKMAANYFRRLYTEGLIHPDIINENQNRNSYAYVGSFLPSPTFNYDLQNTIVAQVPEAKIELFYLAPEKIKLVSQITMNMNAVSSTSEHPEKVIEFFDWLYADQDNFDSFYLGIEGVHYNLTDEGRVEYINDASGTALYKMPAWVCGNLKLNRFGTSYTEKGIQYDNIPLPADQVVYSPMLNFVFDSAPVEMELINLTQEVTATLLPIKLGMVDYEENIGPAIEKLKAAGLDAYIAEYQRQLDAFRGVK